MGFAGVIWNFQNFLIVTVRVQWKVPPPPYDHHIMLVTILILLKYFQIKIVKLDFQNKIIGQEMLLERPDSFENADIVSS